MNGGKQAAMNALRVVELAVSRHLPRLLAPLLLGGGLLVGVAAGPAQAANPPTPAKPAAPAVPAAPIVAPAPPAPTSYDELLKGAVPAKDLTSLLEPLYARCDDGDALHKRQCEGTRAYL